EILKLVSGQHGHQNSLAVCSQLPPAIPALAKFHFIPFENSAGFKKSRSTYISENSMRKGQGPSAGRMPTLVWSIGCWFRRVTATVGGGIGSTGQGGQTRSQRVFMGSSPTSHGSRPRHIMSRLEYPMKTIRQFSLSVMLLAIAVARAQTPQIFQEFNPWTGNTSPDGIWRKNGVWVATGGNTFDPARCILTTSYPGETSSGFL